MFEFINKINQSSLLLICICRFLIIILFVQKIRFSKLIKEARIDAVKRSKAVIGGQTVEQLAPYLPDFPCSPIDAHFIGKPIDFIAFPGLTETNKVTGYGLPVANNNATNTPAGSSNKVNSPPCEISYNATPTEKTKTTNKTIISGSRNFSI